MSGPAFGPNPAPTAIKRSGRRTGVRGLLVLVAACAALLWAARSIRQQTDPTWTALEQLRSADPTVRVGGVVELRRVAETGSPAGVVLPALVEALGDPDRRVRFAAAECLGPAISRAWWAGFAGPEPRAAALALIETMARDDDSVRIVAVRSLAPLIGQSGAAALATPRPLEPERAVDAISALIANPFPAVRAAALAALGGIRDPLPMEAPRPLLSVLKGDLGAEFNAAARAVVSFRLGCDPVIAPLFRAVEASPEGQRSDAGATLLRIRPSVATVPLLVTKLGSDRADVRAYAASLLGEIGPEAAAAIPGLLDLLDEPVPPYIETLRIQGSLYLAGTSGLDPAAQAISALGRIAPGTDDASRVVAALSEVIRSGPTWRRRRAMFVISGNPTLDLSGFDLEGEAAVPALIAALREGPVTDSDLGLVYEAAEALGRLAPETPHAPEAVAALAEALDSPSVRVLPEVVSALARFGPLAAPAAPKLRALGEREPSLQPQVETLLKQLDAAHESLVGWVSDAEHRATHRLHSAPDGGLRDAPHR